ncbi:MAG TPA: DUF6603 domain-containing protein [Solirubrobacteraceae bacterium]|nr:DUF6603 domain-containing protein [Solirubrobacteraceae bacterium]
MATQTGTLELIARELAAALRPLEEQLTAGNAETFVTDLGLRLPPALAAPAAVAASAASTAAAAVALAEPLAALTAAIEADDGAKIASAGQALIGTLRSLLDVLQQLKEALEAATAAAGGLTPAEREQIEAFVLELPRRMLDFAAVEYLRDKGPDLLAAVALTGVIEDADDPGDPSDPLRVPHRRRELHPERLIDAFTRPEQYLADAFGWGTPGFDGTALFTRLAAFLDASDLPSHLITAPGLPPIFEAFLVRLAPTATNPPGLSFRLRIPATRDFAASYVLKDPWSATLAARARFAAGLEGAVQPLAEISLAPPEGVASIDVTAGLRAERPGERLTLLGRAGGSRLDLERFSVEGGVVARFDSNGGTVSGEPTGGLEVAGGRVVIDLSSGDSFVSTIAGGARLESNVGFRARWSPSAGLRIEGSAAIEIAIPTHVTVGPVEISSIYLIAALRDDGSVPIELSAAFSAKLGPLQAAVDRIGMTATARFPDGGGNLGPLDLGLAFKSPTGIGLSIDAAVVKGGGFLSIDAERGEYAGALELVFSGFLTLKAIGLITTRMPDGSRGFSLVVIITAEFGSGIQLGFGFTLLGVGGLLGLNRTMRLEPLMEGVRTGAIDRIMFPRDAVANAQRIISDLRTIFPPQQGIFLIGPMAKLGWGTPPLITGSVGVIIEIPGNIAILGVLRVALPTSDAALIVLQVNFAGAIEFDRKQIYFFAALFESRVLFLTIDGEMGLLVAYGDEPNFVLSVGGLHPSFQPPPLPFPSPRRVSITLVSSPVARVRVEGYFAVTSNTAQFGARAEMFFGLDAVNVQGELNFDALFVFSPFHFVVAISASFSVKVFGIGLFSARIRGALEGPTPWRAHGEGSVSLLFFDVSADFDVTWGESRDTTLPPIEVMPLAKAEFEKAEAWTALLPASANLLVSLRPLPETGQTVVMHPLGVLRITQRRLPLDLTLAKVGSQRPSDVKRLRVTVSGTGLAKVGDTLEQFAPAQFQDLDDPAKLSRPAFGREHGGVDVSATGRQVNSSRLVRRIVRYEEIILDTGFKRRRRRFAPFNAALFELFLAGNRVARADISHARAKALQPFAETIAVQDERYTVAHQATNQAYAAEGMSFASEASAREHMEEAMAGDPTLAGTLHVVPDFELAT